MKKIVAAVASAALMSIIGVSSANAQQFANAGQYTATGSLNLYQTIPGVVCTATFDIEVYSSGAAAITGGSFSPGISFCGNPIAPSGFPWPLQAINATTNTFEIQNLYVFAVNGECSGNLSASALDPDPYVSSLSPNTITIPAGAKAPGIVYATGASVPCAVDGPLAVTPKSGTTGPFDVVP